MNVDKFWSRVTEDESGCWIWTGDKTPNGYGRYSGIGAHRISYELVVGPIPEGLQIDHLCRVRLCVNSDHLEPVTAQTNVLRGTGFPAIHAQQTHCKRGHEFTEANTRITTKNQRRCRTCHRDHSREYHRAKVRALLFPEMSVKQTYPRSRR